MPQHDTDVSGHQDLIVLQKTIDKREHEASKVKFWALSILATLITSALVGLVVHWLGGR